VTITHGLPSKSSDRFIEPGENKSASTEIEQRVEELIGKLTLSEKVSLL
jgi:hypothetical protein